jgi:hypothetical protein
MIMIPIVPRMSQRVAGWFTGPRLREMPASSRMWASLAVLTLWPVLVIVFLSLINLLLARESVWLALYVIDQLIIEVSVFRNGI